MYGRQIITDLEIAVRDVQVAYSEHQLDKLHRARKQIDISIAMLKDMLSYVDHAPNCDSMEMAPLSDGSIGYPPCSCGLERILETEETTHGTA